MKRGDGYGIFRLKELKQNIPIQHRDSLYRLRCIMILNVEGQTRPERDEEKRTLSKKRHIRNRNQSTVTGHA
jgi:hypothetical protein